MHHGSRAKKKKASGRPSDDLQKLKGLKLYVRTYAKNIINLFTTPLETVQFQNLRDLADRKTKRVTNHLHTCTCTPPPPSFHSRLCFQSLRSFRLPGSSPLCSSSSSSPTIQRQRRARRPMRTASKSGCTVNQTTARAPRRNLHWRSRGLPTATAISTPLLGGTKFSATGMAFLGSQAATAATARAAPSPWMRHGRCRLTNRASLASTGATLPT